MPIVVLHSISGTSESLVVEGAEAAVMEKMEVTFNYAGETKILMVKRNQALRDVQQLLCRAGLEAPHRKRRKNRETTRSAKQLHAAAVDRRFENRPRNSEATAEQRCASPRRLFFTFAFIPF